ncbi:hypothetical protein B296_00039360 [Ensete ventricosum]|uniref:Uncharacterized protein n=1 Tax=Ensete ventricosum TaxID=4639 RepID=A0A426YYE6_ENSVE|nr:hypothetical protein B296_00039360 [Ensete ventricosum]
MLLELLFFLDGRVYREILHKGLIRVEAPDVAPPTIKSVSQARWPREKERGLGVLGGGEAFAELGGAGEGVWPRSSSTWIGAMIDSSKGSSPWIPIAPRPPSLPNRSRLPSRPRRLCRFFPLAWHETSHFVRQEKDRKFEKNRGFDERRGGK